LRWINQYIQKQDLIMSIGEVATPLTLPSGLVLPNRLVKAAMAEQLAKNGQASSDLVRVYEKWGEGGWGAIMTGKQLQRLHKIQT
jgi:2,4-dienoyl-CoA reductase-like NADH-dependent reductase (Old Yellow Enzyme family)